MVPWASKWTRPDTSEPGLSSIVSSGIGRPATVTGAFTYEKPFFNTGLSALAYIDFRYVSNQVTGSDLEPTKVQPEYTLFNGRLALKTPGEHWSLELWGRNLTNKEVQQIAFNVPLQGNARGAVLGDPRTYGVTLRFDY